MNVLCFQVLYLIPSFCYWGLCQIQFVIQFIQFIIQFTIQFIQFIIQFIQFIQFIIQFIQFMSPRVHAIISS